MFPAHTGRRVVSLAQPDLANRQRLQVCWFFGGAAFDPGVGKALHERIEALDGTTYPAHPGLGISVRRAFGKGSRHAGVVGLEDTEDLEAVSVRRLYSCFERLTDSRQGTGAEFGPWGQEEVGAGSVFLLLQVTQILPVDAADAEAADLAHHQVQGVVGVETLTTVAESGEKPRPLGVDSPIQAISLLKTTFSQDRRVPMWAIGTCCSAPPTPRRNRSKSTGIFFACYTSINGENSYWFWDAGGELVLWSDREAGHLNGYVSSAESYFQSSGNIPHCPRRNGRIIGAWRHPVLVSHASPGGWRSVILLDPETTGGVACGMQGVAMDFIFYPGHRERVFQPGSSFTSSVRHLMVKSSGLPSQRQLEEWWSQFQESRSEVRQRIGRFRQSETGQGAQQ